MGKERITWGDKTIVIHTKEGEHLFEEFMKEFLGIGKKGNKKEWTDGQRKIC